MHTTATTMEDEDSKVATPAAATAEATNPCKRFNNMLYCHSCGFDVNIDGWNCNSKKSYHQNWIRREKARQFMKDDTWPGSRSGSQKNQYSNGTATGEHID